MKRVVILKTCGSWEGIYIDGKLIDEAHHLGENFLYLLKKSEEYNFTSKDVLINYINGFDEQFVEETGSFPLDLSDLNGKYYE